jgi:hypothetical protein
MIGVKSILGVNSEKERPIKNEEQNIMSVLSSTFMVGISLLVGGVGLERGRARVCAGRGGVTSSIPVDFTILRWKQFEYGREHMMSGYAEIRQETGKDIEPDAKRG